MGSEEKGIRSRWWAPPPTKRRFNPAVEGSLLPTDEELKLRPLELIHHVSWRPSSGSPAVEPANVTLTLVKARTTHIHTAGMHLPRRQ